jgi:hypothetical protein
MAVYQRIVLTMSTLPFVFFDIDTVPALRKICLWKGKKGPSASELSVSGSQVLPRSRMQEQCDQP